MKTMISSLTGYFLFVGTLLSSHYVLGTPTSYFAPQIVDLPDGTKVSVFLQQQLGSIIVMGSKWDSINGWSTPVTLSTPTRGAFAVKIASNALGDVLAYWEATDFTLGTDFVEAITYSSSFTNGWGALHSVSSGGRDAGLADERGIVDSSGGMMLIWSTIDNTGAQSIRAANAPIFAENPAWETPVTLALGSNI